MCHAEFMYFDSESCAEFSEINVGNNKNQVHWDLNNFESYFPAILYNMLLYSGYWSTGGGYVYAA